jgi:hypothetical protein
MTHPAIGRQYEIWIGGVAYDGKCFEVFTRSGQELALCEYMFTRNGPGSSNTFQIPVDKSGNPL